MCALGKHHSFSMKNAEPRDNKLRTTMSILWLSNISLDSDCIFCRAVGCIGGQQTSMWRSKEQKEVNTINKRAVKRPFGCLPMHGLSKNAAQDPDLGFEKTPENLEPSHWRQVCCRASVLIG
jgi:hypothetical protein